jgi:hypothetical protein
LKKSEPMVWPALTSTKGKYFEPALGKVDGTTSKGGFGVGVRLLSENEYQLILARGFALDLAARETDHALEEDLLTAEDQQLFRPSVVTSRLFRDQAFSRIVASAYDFTLKALLELAACSSPLSAMKPLIRTTSQAGRPAPDMV